MFIIYIQRFSVYVFSFYSRSPFSVPLLQLRKVTKYILLYLSIFILYYFILLLEDILEANVIFSNV